MLKERFVYEEIGTGHCLVPNIRGVGWDWAHRGTGSTARAGGAPLMHSQPVHCRGCSGGKSCATFMREKP